MTKSEMLSKIARGKSESSFLSGYFATKMNEEFREIFQECYEKICSLETFCESCDYRESVTTSEHKFYSLDVAIGITEVEMKWREFVADFNSAVLLAKEAGYLF